jgi:hypothetical protein
MGWASQKNVYSRVIVNRKDKSTAIDQFDVNYFYEAPFVARRDLFFPHHD